MQQQFSPDQKTFLNFAETHRVVLNQIFRQSLSHLACGHSSILDNHPRVFDFDVFDFGKATLFPYTKFSFQLKQL